MVINLFLFVWNKVSDSDNSTDSEAGNKELRQRTAACQATVQSQDASAAASQINSREEEINVRKNCYNPVIFTPSYLVLLITIQDFAYAKPNKWVVLCF